MLITLLHHADRVKIACMAQLVNVIAPIMTSDTEADQENVSPVHGNTMKMEDGKLTGVLGKHSWNMIRLTK